MKIKEDLPPVCSNCKRFILKVDDQVFFYGKTSERVLSTRCRFSNVCDEYKSAMKRRESKNG